MLSLTYSLSGQIESVSLPDGVSVIGRRQSADIVINQRSISGNHLRVVVDGESATFTDLGSSNGTFLNEEKSESGTFAPGDTLRLGKLAFRVQLAGETPALPESTPAISGSSATPACFRLTYMLAGTEQTALLSAGSHTIGRKKTNDISINDPSISGMHAKINVSASVIDIVDMGSSNGTFINGTRSEAGSIRNGDQLRLGKIDMQAIQEGAPPAAPTADHDTAAISMPTEDAAPAVSPSVVAVVPSEDGAQPVADGGGAVIIAEAEEMPQKRSVLPLALAGVATMLLVCGIGAAIILSSSRGKESTPTQSTTTDDETHAPILFDPVPLPNAAARSPATNSITTEPTSTPRINAEPVATNDTKMESNEDESKPNTEDDSDLDLMITIDTDEPKEEPKEEPKVEPKEEPKARLPRTVPTLTSTKDEDDILDLAVDTPSVDMNTSAYEKRGDQLFNQGAKLVNEAKERKNSKSNRQTKEAEKLFQKAQAAYAAALKRDPKNQTLKDKLEDATRQLYWSRKMQRLE